MLAGACASADYTSGSFACGSAGQCPDGFTCHDQDDKCYVNGTIFPADAAVPDACQPESDMAFCAARGKNCEMVSGTDNCGATRNVSCGACSGTTPTCAANVCIPPVCGNDFTATGTPVTSASIAGVQDALLGASADGKSILFLRATATCVGSGSTLYIGDDPTGSLNYTNQSISAVANLATFEKTEETMTLTAEGLTVIGAITGGGLRSSTRSAAGAVDFGAPSETMFSTIDANLPTGAVLSWPLMTADGLAFYYRVDGATPSAADGIYEALRTSTASPFALGVLMPAAVQAFTAISGMSTDRLTVFVTVGFGTSIMTRESLNDPFSAPAPAPTAAPGATYHRVVPGSPAARSCSAPAEPRRLFEREHLAAGPSPNAIGAGSLRGRRLIRADAPTAALSTGAGGCRVRSSRSRRKFERRWR